MLHGKLEGEGTGTMTELVDACEFADVEMLY